MIRHVTGEDLKIGSVLTWGPGWYFQKTFFEGKDNAVSTDENRIRYDVEVSGHPSSHTGHLLLLRLKEQDYPGTKRIEDWPSWGLPILKWGKEQGAIVGYTHSGWGLSLKEEKLLSYEMPPFDGIGANEYVVTDRHSRADRCHLDRGYTVSLGAQRLVSHSERRVPRAHQRRDRLPVHLWGTCGSGPQLCPAEEARL
jgi:hypothetical protein